MNNIYIYVKKYKEELILTIGFVLLAMLFNCYRIIGDANYYNSFSQLLLSGLKNFSLGNQLVFQGQGLQQYGASLFYLPFQFLSEILSNTNLFQVERPVLNAVFVGLGTNFYIYISLILLLRIIKRLGLPTLSLYLMFFACPIFVFTFPVIGHAHAIDVFVFTLLVYIFISNSDRPFLLGVLTALSIYVRYVNFVVLISLVVYFLYKDKKQLYVYIGGVVSLLWALPVSLLVFNGSLLGSVARLASPSVEVSPFKNLMVIPPHSFKLLVHPIHGLFIWSPLTLLSINGLILYFKERRDLSLLFLGWFFGLVWLYGYFYYWYAGWSFSQRYLIGLFPLYVLGYAYFLKIYPRRGKWLGVLLTMYSLFLFLNWGTVMHGSEGIPQDILKAWQNNKISVDHYVRRIESNFKIKR